MECQVGDITFYYEEAGSGKPLLCLHGMTLDHRSAASDMEPLFEKRSGWHRLYPDLPGMGKTPAAEWITCQDQVLDLLSAFIDQVVPGERLVIAGSSYGGYLARGLVHHRGSGIDGLLLDVPLIVPDMANRHLPQPRILREDRAFLTALTPDEQDLKEFIVAQSMHLLTGFRQYIFPAVEIADHAFLQRLDQQSAFSFDVDTLPAPFPAPALFLAGRHDNWVGYQDAYQLLENYPRASFAILDCAGHALSVEQQTLFRALVSEWLDRVEEYTHSQ